MNASQHAEKILAAWTLADPAGFEQELEDALRSCRQAAPADHLECERKEVLESVVERLRAVRMPPLSERGRAAKRPAAHNLGSLNAGFALLEHLRQRAVAA